MKHLSLTPVFMPEYQPDDPNIHEGNLYICLRFGSVIHRCCCGCGSKVAIPIKPYWNDGWQFEQDGDLVSLDPSLGNWGLPCKSHYWIKNNQVVWAS